MMPIIKSTGFKIEQDCVNNRKLEEIGRICWGSQDRQNDDNGEKFLKMLINKGHESVLEHSLITLFIRIDRACAAELRTHRHSSLTQSSSRYIRLDQLELIEPFGYEDWTEEEKREWISSCEQCFQTYKLLLYRKPQIARGVLPHDMEARLYMSGNIRQWRHVLNLRANKAAHPQVRKLMLDILSKFKQTYPVVFDDLYEKYLGE